MTRIRDDCDENPFAPPDADQRRDGSPDSPDFEQVKRRVKVPAIGLILVGCNGLLVCIAVIGLVSFPGIFGYDPNAEILLFGSMAFAVVNLLIAIGGFQMLWLKSRTLAIVASVLAIGNVGWYCCVIGAPLGVWCLYILNRTDVIRGFGAGLQRPLGRNDSHAICEICGRRICSADGTDFT